MLNLHRGFCASAISVLLIFGAFAPLHALDQASADGLATYLIAQGGRTNGVCSVPLCGDGMLAVSLLNKSSMIVHATDNNQDIRLLPAFQPLAVQQFRGKRLFIEPGTATQLPYPDRFIDLLVVTGLTDGTLSSLSLSEIKRVLCQGGKAWIGRAAAEGAGITQTGLQTWSGGAQNVAIQATAQGTFAVVTGVELSGIDEWTHREHDPGHSFASHDTQLKWPYLPQSWIKPLGTWRHATAVSQGGRIFLAMNIDPEGNNIRMLRAYRIYNGQLLWTRNLNADWPEDVDVFNGDDPVASSCMVAMNNKLYMMKANTVLVLDGETGQQQSAISMGAAARGVKWITIDTTRLYALVGDSVITDSTGNSLVCYNLTSNTTMWQTNLPDNVDVRNIGVTNGNIYFYSSASRLACYSGTTGSQQWSSQGAFGGSEPQKWTLSYLSRFECSPYGIIGESNGTVFACSPQGTMLWSRANSDTHRLIRDSLLVGSFSPNPINIKNNIPLTSLNITNYGGGCGPFSCSPDALFGQVGGIAYSFSLNKSFQSQQFKSDCSLPPIISNGLLVKLPTACTCTSMFRGMITESSANGFNFNQSSPQLVEGTRFNNIDSTVNADASDWSTYRGSNSRTGFLNVSVQTSPALAWTYTPQVPYSNPVTVNVQGSDSLDNEATPAVTAGGHIFWGGSDGVIRCMQNGTEKWNFATGGRIYAAPTVYSGCVYTGSADGWVYCNQASTGELVWKFRAAPVERKLNLYGRLSSVWPVLSGVLCYNNRAYVVAGFDDQYGACAYALDCHSGSIVWQNSTVGTCYDSTERVGVAPGGYMAVKGTNLWLRGYHGDNALFDLSTGKLAVIPVKADRIYFLGTRGRDIGVLDNNHMVYGGRPIFSDHRERKYFLGCLTFDISRLGANGIPEYPAVSEVQNSSVSPAWDNTDIYCAVDGMMHLEKWSIASVVADVDATQQSHPLDANGDYTVVDNAIGVTSATSLSSWATLTYDINAIIVAANAAIVTESVHGLYDARDQWQWCLKILNKASGAELGSYNLPGEPLHQGLLLDRYGNIMVSLKNGSMLGFGSLTGVRTVAGGVPSFFYEPSAQAGPSINPDLADAQPVDAAPQSTASQVSVVNSTSGIAPVSMMVAAKGTAAPSAQQSGSAVSMGPPDYPLSNDSAKATGPSSSGKLSPAQDPLKSPASAAASEVKLVKSENGQPHLSTISAPASIQTVIPALTQRAGIVEEYWAGIFAGSVGPLSSASCFTDSPTDTRVLDSLQTPFDFADNYAERIRGYVCAPLSGKYRFSLAASGTAILKLSVNDNPKKAKTIVSVSQKQGKTVAQSGKGNSQVIALVKGKRYFFEILRVKGTGSDHCAVSWKRPDKKTEVIRNADLLPFTDNNKLALNAHRAR